MNLSVKSVALIILCAAVNATAPAQVLPPKYHVAARKTVAPLAANTFAYPQSVFVDSRNGNVWVTDFDNNRVLRFDVSALTNVIQKSTVTNIKEYALSQNFPNPFNPQTTITFALKRTDYAAVKVYNVLGQEVATLFNRVALGNELYMLSFNATDLPSGMYIYTLRSHDRFEVKRMNLLK